MKQTRLSPDRRKLAILAAAVALAEKHGCDHLSRTDVAALAGVTGQLIHHYYGTMGALREGVMRYAVAHRNLAIIARGLASFDPVAQSAPLSVQKAALKRLLR